jgi:adenosine kinase
MKKIIVTGSLAFDYIMNFPGVFADNIDPTKLHILSVSFLAETLKKERGGTAGGISYNLGLLKSNPLLLATAGEDFDSYAALLKNSGVDLSGLKIVREESTSLAMILTDKKNNQITSFYPGAMTAADSVSIKDVKGEFCVIAPTKPEAMAKYVKECLELKIPYLYDPGMQLPRLSDNELLEGITGAEILIANDYEMGIIESRVQGQVLGDIKIKITTLGSAGSVIEHQGKKIQIKAANPKEVLDPTGAGDAYRAGFLAGYLRGFDLKTCGQMGSVTSCYTIEKYGTTNHSFTIDEFKTRYKENFSEDLNYEI